MEGTDFSSEESGQREKRISVTNDKIPPPPEILELAENQLASILEAEKAANELRQAMCTTPEEAQRSEELAAQINEKVGRQRDIASELKELDRLLKAPARRVRQVVDRHFRLQEERSDRAGGQ